LRRRRPFQDSGRKIGYCIVGLGRISMQRFMRATRMSKRSRVTAIVSGHRDKAEERAADYGIPTPSRRTKTSTPYLL
jgi:predicted dehydrogenase